MEMFDQNSQTQTCLIDANPNSLQSMKEWLSDLIRLIISLDNLENTGNFWDDILLSLTCRADSHAMRLGMIDVDYHGICRRFINCFVGDNSSHGALIVYLESLRRLTSVHSKDEIVNDKPPIDDQSSSGGASLPIERVMHRQADGHGEAKTKTAQKTPKRARVNAKLIMMALDDPNLYEKTASELSAIIGCAESTIKETEQWNSMMETRARARAAIAQRFRSAI